jgi:hypothetical protein
MARPQCDRTLVSLAKWRLSRSLEFITKFGYKSDMKVIKYKDLSIFLAVQWKLSSKYGYLKKKNSLNLANFKHVFPLKNPLYRLKQVLF